MIDPRCLHSVAESVARTFAPKAGEALRRVFRIHTKQRKLRRAP